MYFSGDYEYRYILQHSDATVDSSTEKRKNTNGNTNRTEVGPRKVMTVRKEDYDVFQALDMDSFVVENARRRLSSKTTDDEADEIVKYARSFLEDINYGQKIPNYTKQKYSSKNPPIIPPHLLHYTLNKKPVRPLITGRHNMPIGVRQYPAINYEHLLPKPCHTLLNHLYAMSLKEDMMTLSTTQRYREKYVTTIFYRPVETESPD